MQTHTYAGLQEHTKTQLYPQSQIQVLLLKIITHSYQVDATWFTQHLTSYTKQFNKSKTVLEKHTLVRSVFLIQELKVLLSLCIFLGFTFPLEDEEIKMARKVVRQLKAA